MEKRKGATNKGGGRKIKLSEIRNKKKYNRREISRKSGREEEIRLNKYIANAGICSRRDADELIKAGTVSVNGRVVTELGTKVKPTDEIRYGGEKIKSERKVYILMNKPKDYVTTVEDPHARKTVMQLLGNQIKERVYPVGRLDRSTTGVLLFTNDGDLAKRLMHPSFKKKKIYHVYLDKALKTTDFQTLMDGIQLEDGPIAADAMSYVSQEDKKQVGLEIHSGRNRIVRRMFEHLGYTVERLDRVYFAGMTKKQLGRGKWRYLTNKEIAKLKMDAFV
jgi:23S rRNA pseudouridine2605 synthase